MEKQWAVRCARSPVPSTWLVGQTMIGRAVSNDARAEHGQPTLSLGRYMHSTHFIEAGWESEFSKCTFL